MPLHVFNVIELRSKRILDVNDDNLPVGFTFIEKCHDAEDLDLFDLTNVTDLLANFTDIEGVIIALGLGLSMRYGRVLPGLEIPISNTPPSGVQ